MRISDWSSDVCSSDLAGSGDRDAPDRPHIARMAAPEPQQQCGADRVDGVVVAQRPAQRLRVANRSGRLLAGHEETGRTSCRERGGHEVLVTVGAVSLKKKTMYKHNNIQSYTTL